VKSLVVLLDEAAPSFCYYNPPVAGSPRRMDRTTFERALGFADAQKLTLQLVCGRGGAEPFVDELVGERPYTRYVPLGSPTVAKDDVLVVEGSGWERGAFGADRHPLCVLRLRRDDLEQLPDAWERLSEHAYRVVLVLLGLDTYDEPELHRYESVLLDLRQRLAAKYLRGEATELNVLSDRLGLEAPVECGAGVDHLTVTPKGELHICPGFALDGAAPVGSLAGGWDIPNASLLERSRAPICGACDAFHCRRCVYMNRRATLEVNTPPWQVCKVAHMEREASRVMLASLHQRRCMERIRPIPPLDYLDPLDPLMQVRHAIPHGASAVPRTPSHREELPRTAGTPSRGAGGEEIPPLDRRVGRVTPEERDEIEELHRRKVGLSALLSTLARMDAGTLQSTPLYERLVRDAGDTTIAYDAWWRRLATRYRWRREREKQTWHVDFETCDVLLD